MEALRNYEEVKERQSERKRNRKIKAKRRVIVKKIELVQELIRIRSGKKQKKKKQDKEKIVQGNNDKNEDFDKLVEKRMKWDKFVITQIPCELQFKKDMVKKYLIPGKEIESNRFPSQ